MPVSSFDKRKHFACGNNWRATIKQFIFIPGLWCFFQFSVYAQTPASKGVAVIKIDPDDP